MEIKKYLLISSIPISPFLTLLLPLCVSAVESHEMLFEPEYTIYIDGASRGNPGPASYGFVVLDPSGKALHKGSGYIGLQTNNVAEYTALLEALRFVLKRGIASIEIRSDSELLVKQLKGEYKIRSEHLLKLYEECKLLLRRIGFYEIKHVRRSMNKIADRLANMALDDQLKKKEPKDG